MKINKLKLATKILAIIILCLIGFVGIYLPWKNNFEMNNLIKDFTLSKDLTGYREITFKVSQDENNKEGLTEENYNTSKKIIEKRLNKLGIQDYNLSLDKSTGTIYLQIPEDKLTDRVVSNITETGNVEIKDSEDENKVLLTNDKLKDVKCFYNTASNGSTSVYMELQFNKEGTEILKDLSANEYKTLPKDEETNEAKEETSEEKSEEESEKQEQKKVTLYISGNATTTTSFDDVIEDGKIDLSMGNASTDADSINESLTSARTISIILNNGPLPLKYEVGENKYVKTDISTNAIRNTIIICSIVIVLLLVYMIVKYKSKGILAAISYIGFAAIYLLLLRIFNVTIALSGIVGTILMLILNYLINIKLLESDIKDDKKYYKQYLDIIMKLIPIFAISIIFVYMPITVLASLGMTMFWGIALILSYNVTVTKHIVD